MTLGECAKFLIRLSRQPEAAAAPLSLHGLSALQHNKPLYSFEDNADYVYDVMWSPVHPALFACVDGMGRLDLWNLNSDTEVSDRRPGPGMGKGDPGHSAVWSFVGGGEPFVDRPYNCLWVQSIAPTLNPQFLTSQKGTNRCIGQNSMSLHP
jgi:hypothetical protein